MSAFGRGGKLGLPGGVLTLLAITACEGSIVPEIVSVEIITAERHELELVPQSALGGGQVRLRATLPYTLRNLGTVPVHLLTLCTDPDPLPGAVMRQWDGKGWSQPESFPNGFFVDCAGPTLTVKPGEEFDGFATIGGPTAVDPGADLVEGRFRLELAYVFRGPLNGEVPRFPVNFYEQRLDEEHRASNTFELALP